MLSTETFISLKQFAHKALWQEETPVWGALLSLKKYLKEQSSYQIEIEIPSGVFLSHPESISIGSGTIIEPGVFIQGPCIIGKNCVIRHGAYIRGDVVCGDRCHIGHCTELKHSILLDEACATHFVYVGDSILGNGVNLGAGVKCANLRLDRQGVRVVVDGKRIDTGLKKFGCVVGDGSQIGCNCVLNPGALVGKGCFSYPLVNIKGHIPAQSVISSQGIESVKPHILEQLLWQSKAIVSG